MKNLIAKLPIRKRVELRDVASPKPSRAAKRAVDSALRRAYKDQLEVTRKATLLRSKA
ncbi:hypothetical protein M1512_00265 [Patescibacteria group bacterium]|jgi:hypothetical protein|nr:hypothetical protein [Patescibacteria group bacterium]